jgi:hypothetical protein
MSQDSEHDDQDYPGIRAWGRHLGSSNYFVKGQIDKARRDQAPANAIYKREEHWVTTDDILHEDVRKAMKLPPLPAKVRAAQRTAAAVHLRQQADELDAEAEEILRIGD